MKHEKGQSLVEFALVIPVFLLLLLGVIDFGRVFHAYLTLDHAGREGARAASLGKTNDEVEKRVKDNAGSLNTSKITVTTNPSTRTPGTDVTVTVTYTVDMFIPKTDPIPLEDKTVMRVE